MSPARSARPSSTSTSIASAAASPVGGAAEPARAPVGRSDERVRVARARPARPARQSAAISGRGASRSAAARADGEVARAVGQVHRRASAGSARSAAASSACSGGSSTTTCANAVAQRGEPRERAVLDDGEARVGREHGARLARRRPRAARAPAPARAPPKRDASSAALDLAAARREVVHEHAGRRARRGERRGEREAAAVARVAHARALGLRRGERHDVGADARARAPTRSRGRRSSRRPRAARRATAAARAPRGTSAPRCRHTDVDGARALAALSSASPRPKATAPQRAPSLVICMRRCLPSAPIASTASSRAAGTRMRGAGLPMPCGSSRASSCASASDSSPTPAIASTCTRLSSSASPSSSPRRAPRTQRVNASMFVGRDRQAGGGAMAAEALERVRSRQRARRAGRTPGIERPEPVPRSPSTAMTTTGRP